MTIPPVALDRTKVREFLSAWVPNHVPTDPAQAAVEATLELRSRQVEIRPGKAGWGYDFDRLADDLVARFAAAEPAARVVAIQPVWRVPLTEQALAPVRDLAGRLVSQPMALHCAWGDWTLTSDQFLAMLRLPGGGAAPYLGRDVLLARTQDIAARAEAAALAAGARDPLGQPWKVDVAATAAEIWAHAQTADRNVDLRWIEPPSGR